MVSRVQYRIPRDTAPRLLFFDQSIIVLIALPNFIARKAKLWARIVVPSNQKELNGT
jgi:hypothetical protein